MTTADALEASNDRMRMDAMVDALEQSDTPFLLMGSELVAVSNGFEEDRLADLKVRHSKGIIDTFPSPVSALERAIVELECGKDQALFFRGVVGSGKTVLFRKVLNEVLNRGILEETQINSILSAHIVISQFITAQTFSNSHSTRCALRTSLKVHKSAVRQFSFDIACMERTRITNVPGGESNFIIFHSLLKLSGGKFKRLSNQYRLDHHETHFRYLLGRTSEGHAMPVHSFTERFVQHWDSCGLDDFMFEQMVRVMALILYLGNIDIEETESSKVPFVSQSDEKSKEAVEMVSLAGGCDFRVLERCFCSDVTGSRSQRIARCYERIDAFSQCLYVSFFSTLMERVNSLFTFSRENGNSISLIDMFGYEGNGSRLLELEKLMSNYANETVLLKIVERMSQLNEKRAADALEFSIESVQVISKQGILDALEDPSVDETAVLHRSLSSRSNSCLLQMGVESQIVVSHSFGDEMYSTKTMYKINQCAMFELSDKGTGLIGAFKIGEISKTYCKRFDDELRNVLFGSWMKGVDVQYIHCVSSRPHWKNDMELDRWWVEDQLRTASFDLYCVIMSDLYPREISTDMFYESFGDLVPSSERKEDRRRDLLEFLKNELGLCDSNMIHFFDTLRFKADEFEKLMSFYCTQKKSHENAFLKQSILKKDDGNRATAKNVQWSGSLRAVKSISTRKRQASSRSLVNAFIPLRAIADDSGAESGEDRENMFVVEIEEDHPQCSFLSIFTNPVFAISIFCRS